MYFLDFKSKPFYYFMFRTYIPKCICWTFKKANVLRTGMFLLYFFKQFIEPDTIPGPWYVYNITFLQCFLKYYKVSVVAVNIDVYMQYPLLYSILFHKLNFFCQIAWGLYWLVALNSCKLCWYFISKEKG